MYFSLGGMVDRVDGLCIRVVTFKQKVRILQAFNGSDFGPSCRFDMNEKEIVPEESLTRNAFSRRPLFKRSHFSYLPCLSPYRVDQ